MSVYSQPLRINGQAVDDLAQLDLSVQIESIGGSTLHRLSDGSAVKQTVWQKRQLTISASGWLPAALDALDASAPITVDGGSLDAPITGFTDGIRMTRNPQSADFQWQLTIQEA